MDEISLIQTWSRYSNKVQALQQTLGLPVLQKSEKVELDPRWVTYNSHIHDLKTKLGIHTHDSPQQLTFYKYVASQADDSPGMQRAVCSKLYATGRDVERDMLQHYGHPAIQTMMERYSGGTLKKASNAPPAQNVLDKLLVTRRLAHVEHVKNLDETIRKLEATKEQLKKELKNLKAQKEFFGNGRKPQAGEPYTLSLTFDPRLENKNANLLVTDLLNGLENVQDESLMDDIIEEVMSANVSYQPKKRDPETLEQIQKLTLQVSIDRAMLLTEEEIILESTSEICKEVAIDVFRRAVLSLEFETHFDSTKVQEYLKSTNPLDY